MNNFISKLLTLTFKKPFDISVIDTNGTDIITVHLKNGNKYKFQVSVKYIKEEVGE